MVFWTDPGRICTVSLAISANHLGGNRLQPLIEPRFVAVGCVGVDDPPFRGTVNDGESRWKQFARGGMVILIKKTTECANLMAQAALAHAIDYGATAGYPDSLQCGNVICHC